MREIRVGRKRAPVCRAHLAKYGPKKKARPVPEADVVIPPLCDSCGAEITWTTIVKRDGTISRMPIDRRSQDGREPRASMVVRNPATGRSRVLSRIDLPAVPGWLAKGCHLHASHFVTCPSAALHRKRAA